MLINGYKMDFCSRKEGRIVTGEIQQEKWSSNNMHMLASVVSLNYALAT